MKHKSQKSTAQTIVSRAILEVTTPLETKSALKAQLKVYNGALGEKNISTMGGILVDKRGKLYGLGTCHGLKQDLENRNSLSKDEATSIFHLDEKKSIGQLEFFTLNDSLDIAFIQFKEETPSFLNDFKGKPSEVYTLSNADAGILKVVVYSSVRDAFIEGVLLTDKSEKSRLQTSRVTGVEMSNLGVISTDKINGKALTVAGDSGAWVRKADDLKVIGMIVGVDEALTKSYFVKMTDILASNQKKQYKIFS